ncbi:MAG: cupin domain-containing protein, partial [Saccharofermentanales bacterium]
MISKELFEEAKKKALQYFDKAGISLTVVERDLIEVADFGLGDLWNTGLEILTYVNTDRVCAKELVLTPFQTCPEHRHPPFGDYIGKEETFRCRYGEVYLYVDGTPSENPKVSPPKGTYT